MNKILKFILWIILLSIVGLGVYFFLNPTLIIDHGINDRSVVLGLGMSLMGFGITIWQIRQTKTVAQAAKMAAEEAKNELIKKVAITDLSKAVREITHVKRYFKNNTWEKMADSCEYVVGIITSVKMENQSLEPKEIELLRKAGNIFSTLETELNEAISQERTPDIARLMQRAKEPAISLQELLERIKRT